MPSFHQTTGSVLWNSAALLAGGNSPLTLQTNPELTGCTLLAPITGEDAFQVFDLGRLPNLARFTGMYRFNPTWMNACAGEALSTLPVETQYLLCQRSEAPQYVLLVPLVGDGYRAALQGTASGHLELAVEVDPEFQAAAAQGVYIACGNAPYPLIEQAAREVARLVGGVRLRAEKPLPAFIDGFGWCTWDAFYTQVSHEAVRSGLTSFQQAGVQPRFLILDDGWQTVCKAETGEVRLASFAVNEKFPGGLSQTTRMAKEEFGIRAFLVWQTLTGYWGGADPAQFHAYGTQPVPKQFLPIFQKPEEWYLQDQTLSLPSPEGIARFFEEYHATLEQQGVDGVKVDAQGFVEGTSHAFGGRVSLIRCYRQALEQSVTKHFQGNLMNCAASSTENIYAFQNSNLNRTSDDFFPNRPESHGKHLYTNAQAGVWFGQFIHPDWDMFQSAHPAGAFHAAGRAVSGGPVYVSDPPEKHNVDLLNRLVLPNGSILRSNGIGKPTPDCLFHDPTQEAVAWKVYNCNPCGFVLAAFNCLPPGESAHPVEGGIRLSDLPEAGAGEYIAYAHRQKQARRLTIDEDWTICLSPLEWEIFTLAPLQHGAAPLGLVNLLNSGAAVDRVEWMDESAMQITCHGVGDLAIYANAQPRKVQLDAMEVDWMYDLRQLIIHAQLPNCTGYRMVRIDW